MTAAASESATIAIIGANGNLGLKLLRALPGHAVIALVRSSGAAATVASQVATHALDNVTVKSVDYHDLEQMRTALQGVDYLIHLVGIIKETASNSFRQAHVAANEVLCEAVRDSGIKRLCHLSILGADVRSANACLRSRGEAEQLLLAAVPATLILRIPMVLGGDDYASHAIRQRASAATSFTFRASSLEQPIAAQDVIAALLADIARGSVADEIVELAGPESLTRAELYRRAAALKGNSTRVISLPLALGMGLALVMEKLTGNPPVTRAMLGVLDHDDKIDPGAAARQLGVELTDLDSMLRSCLAER